MLHQSANQKVGRVRQQRYAVTSSTIEGRGISLASITDALDGFRKKLLSRVSTICHIEKLPTDEIWVDATDVSCLNRLTFVSNVTSFLNTSKDDPYCPSLSEHYLREMHPFRSDSFAFKFKFRSPNIKPDVHVFLRLVHYEVKRRYLEIATGIQERICSIAVKKFRQRRNKTSRCHHRRRRNRREELKPAHRQLLVHQTTRMMNDMEIFTALERVSNQIQQINESADITDSHRTPNVVLDYWSLNGFSSFRTCTPAERAENHQLVGDVTPTNGEMFATNPPSELTNILQADPSVFGSPEKPISGPYHLLLGQPGSIPALVLPSGGMAARHRKGATAESFFLDKRRCPRACSPNKQKQLRRHFDRLLQKGFKSPDFVTIAVYMNERKGKLRAAEAQQGLYSNELTWLHGDGAPRLSFGAADNDNDGITYAFRVHLQRDFMIHAGNDPSRPHGSRQGRGAAFDSAHFVGMLTKELKSTQITTGFSDPKLHFISGAVIRREATTQMGEYVVIIDSMTSVFNTDASLMYNHDLKPYLYLTTTISNQLIARAPMSRDFSIVPDNQDLTIESTDNWTLLGHSKLRVFTELIQETKIPSRHFTCFAVFIANQQEEFRRCGAENTDRTNHQSASQEYCMYSTTTISNQLIARAPMSRDFSIVPDNQDLTIESTDNWTLLGHSKLRVFTELIQETKIPSRHFTCFAVFIANQQEEFRRCGVRIQSYRSSTVSTKRDRDQHKPIARITPYPTYSMEI
ncbi:hypothetical protein CLF_112113 [Clonorchis sinensis]|uniref:Uncharacterized protein n=1 Tax=Clonorchis sinensis TaxID=79923 RepID=G7YVV3_CLOSI|nr:hypothetical protein CLF_112113 [Clonorchis sinensis]